MKAQKLSGCDFCVWLLIILTGNVCFAKRHSAWNNAKSFLQAEQTAAHTPCGHRLANEDGLQCRDAFGFSSDNILQAAYSFKQCRLFGAARYRLTKTRDPNGFGKRSLIRQFRSFGRCFFKFDGKQARRKAFPPGPP